NKIPTGLTCGYFGKWWKSLHGKTSLAPLDPGHPPEASDPQSRQNDASRNRNSLNSLQHELPQFARAPGKPEEAVVRAASAHVVATEGDQRTEFAIDVSQARAVELNRNIRVRSKGSIICGQCSATAQIIEDADLATVRSHHRRNGCTHVEQAIRMLIAE